jgi:glutathione synthase/RimK-type ligase-like ATP-grasp enzyme
MLKLAIATSREHALGHPDDLPLYAALPEYGIESKLCVWNDDSVDWHGYDAVLIRTIWDYYRHYDEWLAWLDRLDATGVRVLNPTAVLRWNSDKRYLVELEALGIATIPTRLASASALPETLATCGWNEVVIKPAVSAGAWHTLRGLANDPVLAHALDALPRDVDFLVQPYVPAVAASGEWSLMFFAGAYSHAVLKRPRNGDFRVQEKHGGTHVSAEPNDTIVAEARAALARLVTLHNGDLSYARVDGVFDAGVLRVMELELIEPQLFFADDPQSPARFAASLARQLRGR